MNQARRAFPGLVLAALLTLAGGCATTGTGTVKTQGVYTTVAVNGNSLDLPGTQYATCRNFGPEQAPAAVVTGYGFPETAGGQPAPERFTLQLVESSTGRQLFSEDGDAYYGRAAILPLPIRVTGAYQLRLFFGKSEADTWDFTVQGEAAATGANTNAVAPAYAKGNFSASLEQVPFSESFSDYDQNFLYALLSQVQMDFGNADQRLFAQIPPGKVTIQFTQQANGQIDSPQVLANSLNDAFGNLFLKALTNGHLAKPWPVDVRQTFGKDSRQMTATLNYD